jgi:hypothetical protein
MYLIINSLATIELVLVLSYLSVNSFILGLFIVKFVLSNLLLSLSMRLVLALTPLIVTAFSLAYKLRREALLKS